MAALGSLVVKLAVDYAEFTGGLDKGEQAALAAAKKVQDTLDGIKYKAASVAGALAGSLVAAVSVGAIKQFIGHAIEAADEVSKLAQKTGLLVPQVAGLQLAFSQSGAGADVMQTSIANLSKNMADGNPAFAAMGINTKTLEGNFKSTRQILGEVSDKFSGYAEGAEKIALAQELFGKSGADLLPLLNAGSQALDDYDALAKKLGLTLDKDVTNNAEKFNDTMDLAGQSMKGMGLQIAAQLLPTLTGLAGNFIETMTSGDKLKNTADFLASTLKGLYVVVVTGVGLFDAMGTTIGGVAAAVVAAVKGDFSGAMSILKENEKDVNEGWNKTLKQAADAWNTTGNEAVSAMVAIQGEGNKTAPVVSKVAKSAKEATDEFAKLRDKITGKQSGTDADFIKNLQILQTALNAGRIGMEEYLKLADQYVRSQKYMVDALKEVEKATQATADARHKEADGIAAWFAEQDQAAAASLKGVNDRIVSLQAEGQALDLSRELNISLAEAVERLTIARLEEKKATFVEGSDGYAALQREIDARKELATLVGGKEAREQESRGWSDMWSSVDRSAHDVFVNVLQGGQDTFKRLGNTLKTSVLDVLYQMTVRKWIISIGTSIFGAGFGMAANAATGGGAGGGGLGTIASGASLFGGSAFGMGLSGAWGAGGGLMSTLGAGASLLGSGTLAGIGSGLGIIAGALGPIALALAVLPSLFGHTLKDSGIQGTFGGDSGFEGRSYKFYEGSLFSSDKTTYGALDEQVRKTLGDTFKAMKAQVSDFADALGLSTERLKGFTSDVKISLKGLDDSKVQAALQEALATANNDLAEQVIGSWKDVTTEVTRQVQNTAAEMEAGGNSTRSVTSSQTVSTYTPSEFARDGEKAIDTLTRLATSLGTVNSIWDTLGYTMLEASLAGGDAASKIADAFGGLDKMTAATSSYYQDFYSEEERKATAQRQLETEVGKLGFALPKTRDEYRKLVEAQDLNTEAGRKAYAALVQLSPAFAEITTSAEQAAQAAKDLLKSQLDSAYSALERAVQAQQKLLQDQRSAVQELADGWKAVADVAGSAVRDLLGDVSSTAAQQAARGMVYVEQALADAKAGLTPDSAGLAQAISDARGAFTPDNYATQFELDRDRLVLAGNLAELQKASGKQLTTAEQTLADLDRQIRQGDDTLEQMKKLIDAATGNVEATLSVADAVKAIHELLDPKAPDATSGGGSGGGASFGGGSGAANAPAADAKYRRVTGVGTGVAYVPIIDQAEIDKLDALSGTYHAFDGTGDLKGLLAAIKEKGGTLKDLEALSGLFYSDWVKAAGAVGIPAFAVGTNYVPRDMLAKIHEGEAIIPRAYNPAAGGQGGQANTARLESLVVALTAEVQRLRTEVATGNSHQKTTATVLAYASEGGYLRMTAV